MSELVLIVDDDSYSREYLNLLLTTSGYAVLEAQDGEQALSLMRQNHPELVLLDIVMPGRDGLAICKEMQHDDRLKDIPVVFLSAKGESGDKIAGLDAGGADYVTKPFDPGEVLARVRTQVRLRGLSEELRRANAELRSKQARIDEDLEAAGHIQQSLLPTREGLLGPVSISWRFRPSSEVGGDIFNVVNLTDTHRGFYILDVSGHGVPAALVAVSAFQALQPESGVVLEPSVSPGSPARPASPAVVLSRLDKQFPMHRFDRYFSMFYLVLDVASGAVVYSAAGHPPGVLLKKSGELVLLEKGGSLVGLASSIPFDEGKFVMECGDAVILYTDGLTDFENARGEAYGENRFIDRLRGLAGQDLNTVVQGVWASMLEFGGGAEPADDISLFGMSFMK